MTRARAAAAAALVAALVAAAPADPILVGPGDVPDGVVDLVPAVQVADDGRAVWALRNGGTTPLTFALTVHALAADADGTPEPGAEVDGALRRDEVVLAPGEQARIPAADVGDDGAVLVAATVDADPDVTLSATALPGGAADVDAAVALQDGALAVTLASARPAVVDLRLRARTWPGVTVADVTLDDVLVVPPQRRVVQPLPAGATGRVTLEAAARAHDGAEIGAHTQVWRWPAAAVRGVAVVVFLAAAALVLWRVRRTRHPA